MAKGCHSRTLSKMAPRRQQLILNHEWHNLDELDLLFIAIRKTSNRFPITSGSPLCLTWRSTPGA
jgi:hypothetical protein